MLRPGDQPRYPRGAALAKWCTGYVDRAGESMYWESAGEGVPIVDSGYSAYFENPDEWNAAVRRQVEAGNR